MDFIQTCLIDDALALNVTKTTELCSTSKGKLSDSFLKPLITQGQAVEQVKSFKYLDIKWSIASLFPACGPRLQKSYTC